MPIPPRGWGAVENIIHCYHRYWSTEGHRVTVLNLPPWEITRAVLQRYMRGQRFDWVHNHHERSVGRLQRLSRFLGFRLLNTTHLPIDYTKPTEWTDEIRKSARAPYHVCLTEETANAVRLLNSRAEVAVIPNGAEVGRFCWQPNGNGRAVCVAKVQPRKHQSTISRLLTGTDLYCDIVGPIDEEYGESPNVPYLGEWDRERLYRDLTRFSAMVLYSDAEGHSLAVIEGMAAGLSVVVSPAAARHLDLDLPFVKVAYRPQDIPGALAEAIRDNGKHRKDIRSYVARHFDVRSIADRHLEQMREWMR